MTIIANVQVRTRMIDLSVLRFDGVGNDIAIVSFDVVALETGDVGSSFMFMLQNTKS